MKKNYTTLAVSLLFLLAIFGFPDGLRAQCTPNLGITGPGYYPSPMPHACKDYSYGTQLDIVFPVDTVIFGNTVPFDSFVLSSVTNVPAGLNFDLNSPSGHYVANPPSLTRACANVSGVPTVSNVGADTLELNWTYFVTVFGMPSPLTVTEYVQLTVLEGPVVGFSATSTGLDVTFVTTSLGLFGHFWDFGDGATSTLENPVYSYAAPGVYNVCLMADDGVCPTTFCQTVTVSLTGVSSGFSEQTRVWPNPARDNLKVSLPGIDHGTRLSVQDIYGKTILVQAIKAGETQVELSLDDIESGTYFLVSDGEQGRKTMRFQVMR